MLCKCYKPQSAHGLCRRWQRCARRVELAYADVPFSSSLALSEQGTSLSRAEAEHRRSRACATLRRARAPLLFRLLFQNQLEPAGTQQERTLGPKGANPCWGLVALAPSN